MIGSASNILYISRNTANGASMKSVYLFGILFLSLAVQAAENHTNIENVSEKGADYNQSETKHIDVSARLNKLTDSLKKQRQDIRSLNTQLSKTVDDADRELLEQKRILLRDRITRSQLALEQLVIGGIDTSIMADTAPEKVAWQDEIQEILLPVLASLRELTAKPRRIEALRSHINHQEERLETVNKVLLSINSYSEHKLEPDTQELIAVIAEDWQAQEIEINQNLDLARVQLNNVASEKIPWAESLVDIFDKFLRDRGITILFAAAAGTATWLLLGSIFSIYMRLLKNRHAKSSRTRLRLIQFIQRGITSALAIVAVVSVFYLRSDILLFTLSVILVIFLLISLRQTLPKYIREGRLLLNIGAVREGERVLIKDVPYEVKTINIHCVFYNPKLRGIRRLPLSKLEGMESRPSLENESWFPTSNSDVVLLPNEQLAVVKSQTIDFVKLRLVGSTVTLATADFLAQGVRNLSCDGFGLPVLFGIDYKHQDIILKEVPSALRNGVISALTHANLYQSMQELSVELGEAAANSLNIRIFATFDGDVSSQYYSLRRLINRACVQVCNENSWVIPFTQITLHQGQGFERLSSATQP